MRDGHGNIVQCLSIQRGVTKRKRAEARLAELLSEVQKSRSDLSSILNELRLGTVLTDENGRIVFLNEMAQRLFGNQGSAAYGKPWQE